MKIEQIRNATLVIDFGDKRFLIDPWLQEKGKGAVIPSPDPEKNKDASPLIDLPCKVEEVLAGVDACIVTHTHLDHFTQEYLPKEMLYFVKDGKDEKKLHKMGFLNTKCFEKDSLTIGTVELTKTKGKHGTNLISTIVMGKVCGIVFKHVSEKTLYLAGDTVYYEEVESVLRKERPEVIILNACDARMKRLGRLLMNRQDVLQIRREAPEAKLIISHLDAVNHAFLTRKDYLMLKDQEQVNNMFIPEDGETIQI